MPGGQTSSGHQPAGQPAIARPQAIDPDDIPLTLQPVAARPMAAPRPLPAPRPIPLGANASPAVRTRTEEESVEEEIKKKVLKFSPPLLFSAVIHMLIIIIMGLWVLQIHVKKQLELNVSYTDTLGQQLIDDRMNVFVDKPEKTDQPVMADLQMPRVSDPFAQPKLSVNLGGTLASTAGGVQGPAISIALAGREQGVKQALLGMYGGNKESENSVDAGLAWLERNMQKNGSWSLKGPYSAGAVFENYEAATAMALLAFQGNGHSHRTGKYQKNVAAGLKFLLRSQDAEGSCFQSGQRDERLYTQAQCTIALCELYAMTKDSEVRGYAQKALNYCLKAQDTEGFGGWRYQPGNDSDTSVTGWMAMALQSAKMGGLQVPDDSLKHLSRYLDQAATDQTQSKYSYLPGQQVAGLAMTAEALLCREYLGWRPDDKRLIAGARFIADNPPRWEDRDVYYWYYATQMMHHMEGDLWRNWNGVQRDLLVKHQDRAGKDRGSWNPLGEHPDIWAERGQGGRLYVTCLSLYILEVYYRHLPLYSPLKQHLLGAGQ
ncbi:MAG TPA: prenyltransferase/squalene oxidase repeat-containing protein [Pirellulales bacterium]|jgi:hypothetical protein|nr:prenyltransferase/squalene oxidase repeat-containing protein [Pirellulales bacterium]